MFSFFHTISFGNCTKLTQKGTPICMKISIQHVPTLLKKTFQSWWAKDPFRESATIAYYAIFSLPALLVIIVATAGMIFGEKAVNGQIYTQVSRVMGADTGAQIQSIVEKAGHSHNSVWAAILGIITLLFGATGVFAQLQQSLNLIWEVKAKPAKTQKSIWLFVRTRLFSFGLIISTGFLLLISLVVDSALAAVSNYLRSVWPTGTVPIFHAIDIILSLGMICVLFALMFKWLPDVKTKWKYIWSGAFLTAALFTLGRYGMGLYFGKAQPESTYGAAGSVVLILLWVSYSSMILFFGAEFTRATTLYYEGEIKPDENAVKTTAKN